MCDSFCFTRVLVFVFLYVEFYIGYNVFFLQCFASWLFSFLLGFFLICMMHIDGYISFSFLFLFYRPVAVERV